MVPATPFIRVEDDDLFHVVYSGQLPEEVQQEDSVDTYNQVDTFEAKLSKTPIFFRRLIGPLQGITEGTIARF